MKNVKPKPSELSSSCSKILLHIHLDHSDHNEDQYSHQEQYTEQLEERPVAQEQQGEQPKTVQPRQKKPARGQHPEDEPPHYEPQQEHPSVKLRGDEQAAGCD
jgi:hypothetical protein